MRQISGLSWPCSSLGWDFVWDTCGSLIGTLAQMQCFFYELFLRFLLLSVDMLQLFSQVLHVCPDKQLVIFVNGHSGGSLVGDPATCGWFL
jgi:hypothetical protein